ncbi:MAG: ankyrin repeat domain-containing protein, partial [Planctomycetales bacterium]
VNYFGDTPLHEAAEDGHSQMVAFLLKSGASPNFVDIYGSTPLHDAAKRGKDTVVRQLLAARASVNARTKDGKTATALARENNYPSTVSILRASGGR